jgi:AhpD family alkylhydroperoxidase
MTALRRVPREAMPPAYRARVERAEELTGDTRFLEVLANAPHVCELYYDRFYDEVFYAGCVPVRTKELLRLRLAGLHGCMYCQRSDTDSARRNGVTEAEIAAIWASDPTGFDAADRSVLAYADEISMARPEGSVSDELLAELRTHLDDDQIVELGVVAAILTGMAKLLFALGLVDRDVVCTLPERSA